MTEFDFYLAFVIPILCGFNQCRVHHDLYQQIINNLELCPVDESIVESASIYSINPTDALRLATAVECGLDGIITWEPLHFVQKQEDEFPIRQYAKGNIFVTRSIDADSDEEVEIRMFVSSVSAFLNDADHRSEQENNEVRVNRFRLHNIQLRSYCAHGYVLFSVSLQNQRGETRGYSAYGNGSINTLFNAIHGCVREFTNLPSFDETYYRVPTLGRIDAAAEVEVCITMGNSVFQGIGHRDDILWASADAYVNAINRLLSNIALIQGQQNSQE